MSNGFKPIGAHGHETTLSVAAILTRPQYATHLLIQTRGANVCYTLDGSNPTATRGFEIDEDEGPVMIDVSAISEVRVIETEASAAIDYQWGAS